MASKHLSVRNTKGSLIPVLRFRVGKNAKEALWTADLASFIGGASEVKIDFGRVDVLSDNYAIEVDFLRKWKEGLGQAIYYGEATQKIPVLALIDLEISGNREEHASLLGHIEGLCVEKGVKLILLESAEAAGG